MSAALRQLLISRGAIEQTGEIKKLIALGQWVLGVPLKPSPKPPVLRMDDRGKRAAARHIEEFWADPDLWASRPFFFPEPEEFFDTQEYPTKEVRQ